MEQGDRASLKSRSTASGTDPQRTGSGLRRRARRYVDAKMRVASRETVTGDTLKIAVLAALNIADECFRLQADDREGRTRSPLGPKSSTACSTSRWGSTRRTGRRNVPRATANFSAAGSPCV